MNEEEKKAVKFFYNLRATIDESNMLFDEEINVKHGKETIKQITIILNLIEKLQKENEELKNKLSLKQFDINVVYNDYLEKLNEYKENSIPIQKVKEKIGEINKKILNALKYDEKISVYRYQKQILQELLKESEEK